MITAKDVHTFLNVEEHWIYNRARVLGLTEKIDYTNLSNDILCVLIGDWARARSPERLVERYLLSKEARALKEAMLAGKLRKFRKAILGTDAKQFVNIVLAWRAFKPQTVSNVLVLAQAVRGENTRTDFAEGFKMYLRDRAREAPKAILKAFGVGKNKELQKILLQIL